MLEAAARLPDIRVELMGGTFPRDGGYEYRLRQRAERSDLAGRVRFLGHISDPLATMRTWTLAISASVQPEAGPLSVLEAMSLGLPVVGTDHGGTREALDGIGQLVPSGDAAAMADAIQQVVGNEALRDRLGHEGRTIVEHRYALNDAETRFVATMEALRLKGTQRDRQ